ncbi:MAG TPA: hypothetical protein VIY49_23700 [Bryobacteraceae bacterium]
MLEALCDSSVEFVVIGGVSGVIHGSAQVTLDLDICFARDLQNLKRLAMALRPFHPRPRDFPAGLPFVWDETTLANGTVFTLKTDLGDMDLLVEVAGVGTYDEVRKESVWVEAFGRKFATLNVRALIRAKRAAGRAKDLSALPELESLLEAGETDSE